MVILNKIDLLPYLNFDKERFYQELRQINAEIPIIETDDDRRRQKLRRIGIIAAIMIVLLVSILLVHFLYMPLDVLWYTAQRRLGIF